MGKERGEESENARARARTHTHTHTHTGIKGGRRKRRCGGLWGGGEGGGRLARRGWLWDTARESIQIYENTTLSDGGRGRKKDKQ